MSSDNDSALDLTMPCSALDNEKIQPAPTSLVNSAVEIRTFEIIKRLRPAFSEPFYFQLVTETAGDDGSCAQGIDPVGHLTTLGD